MQDTDPSSRDAERLRREAREKAELARQAKLGAAGMAATGAGAPEALAMAAAAKKLSREAKRLKKEAKEARRQPAPVAPGYAPPSKPAWRYPLVQAFLILIAGATLFTIFNRLGVRTPFNATVILALAILAALFRAAPETIAKIFRAIALIFGGIIGFIALAMMPFPLPHIFTTVFLLFYIISVFVIWGRKAGFFILVFNLLIFVPLFSTNMYIGLFVPNTPIYDAVEGQQQAWENMFFGFTELGREIKRGVEIQYYYALGDYEEGVEAQSDKKLGVFLENVGITSKIVRPTDRIDVYGRLRAESFKTEKPLEINVKCYEDGHEEDRQGKIIPRATFAVEEYEIQDIDCLIDADDLGPGTHRIVLETTFDFVTSSYLKTYFMEQDRIRAIRRQQADPQAHVLDAFGIAEKDPLAVFTGGPLKIGMGVAQQPVPLIPESTEYGPTLTVTLDRNWLEGELYEVSKLIITGPPGLTLRDLQCNALATGEQECTIEGTELEKLIGDEKPVPTPKTVRIFTSVRSIDGIQTILADSPMAIRSFKATATYTYRIKKQVDVTVRSTA